MRGARMNRCARSLFQLWGGQRRRNQRSRRGRFASVESLESRQVLSGIPIISEFLASNDRIIEDQDGDDSDYIELYNAGDEDMSLNRYYLTDDPNDLQKWRLPDVLLPPAITCWCSLRTRIATTRPTSCIRIFVCSWRVLGVSRAGRTDGRIRTLRASRPGGRIVRRADGNEDFDVSRRGCGGARADSDRWQPGLDRTGRDCRHLAAGRF